MAAGFKDLPNHEKRAAVLIDLASNMKEKEALELLRSLKKDQRCETLAMLEPLDTRMKIIVVSHFSTIPKNLRFLLDFLFIPS